MTAAWTFLVDALQRVADGGDMDETEFEAAVPAPLALDNFEKIAREALSHWTDDDDIRARNEWYASYNLDRLRECIAMFSADHKYQSRSQDRFYGFTSWRKFSTTLSLD